MREGLKENTKSEVWGCSFSSRVLVYGKLIIAKSSSSEITNTTISTPMGILGCLPHLSFMPSYDSLTLKYSAKPELIASGAVSNSRTLHSCFRAFLMIQGA
jgi:hypothetical protein